MKNSWLLFPILIFMISGCTNKNKEELFPQNVCDTTNVKFSTTIEPILLGNCVICHSGLTANGSPQVQLDSYAGVKIVAGNGRLYNALTGTTQQMPPTGRLTDCTLSKIKKWIDSGSINN